MIRPFRSETERYGDYSKAGEFVYDHPFQWGSKRTGPDLHRVGKKFPNLWHFMHMDDPRSVSPGSIMPAYPWLYTQDIDTAIIAGKIRAMQKLGVPYPKEYDRQALTDLKAQAEGIALDLQKQNAPGDPTKEIIALIAYLQRLGTDITVPQEYGRAKMLSQYLETIAGIAAYPIVSLFVFVPFFIGVVIYVLRMKKDEEERMSQLPLQ
jgi:cytochrome c oxidase cbb3-type subunit I/II